MRTDGSINRRAIDERARMLREKLLAIQERRVPDTHGWISEVLHCDAGMNP